VADPVHVLGVLAGGDVEAIIDDNGTGQRILLFAVGIDPVFAIEIALPDDRTGLGVVNSSESVGLHHSVPDAPNKRHQHNPRQVSRNGA